MIQGRLPVTYILFIYLLLLIFLVLAVLLPPIPLYKFFGSEVTPGI